MYRELVNGFRIGQWIKELVNQRIGQWIPIWNQRIGQWIPIWVRNAVCFYVSSVSADRLLILLNKIPIKIPVWFELLS